MTKIIFEEQNQFVVDIDGLKNQVLSNNFDKVAKNFSKVKSQIKVINKAKLFNLGSNKLNENQKDKFFNQQKQLKNENLKKSKINKQL